jgi:Tfp pilus assembly protein PilF
MLDHMHKILVLAILAGPAWDGWVEKYRSGEALLDERRSAIALERLQVAAKEAEAEGASDAQLAAVYDALGRAAMESGQYLDGKRYFERALRLAADGPVEAQAAVTSNLGQACQALGQVVRAEQHFRQALAIMPNRAAVLNQLGGVLYLQHRYEEAEGAFRKALLYAGGLDSVTARSDLALIYEARGKLREAAGLYEQAVSSTPAGQARARMLANLGALRLKLGNPADAVVALGRSLEEIEIAVGPVHPDVAHVLEIYERALRRAGHKAQAIDVAQRANAIRSSFTTQDNATRAIVDYLDLK